ncbi:unnamed protein product, partial [Ixodes pacificus]
PTGFQKASPPVDNGRRALEKMGPMMSRQKELPPIPVAPLQETLNRYLKSLKLLLTTEQFEETQKVVSEFRRKNGDGEKLHKLLSVLTLRQQNWVSIRWIEEKFLRHRDPLLFKFSRSVSLPKQKIETKESMIRYAAGLVAGTMDFKHLIDRQLLKPETSGTAPLDMTQHQNMFNAYRVPRINCDHLEVQLSRKRHEEPSRTVLVIHKDQFFIINTCDPRGIPYSEHRIMSQLLRVVHMTQKNADKIGLLTASDRDIWANAHTRLCKSPRNAESLEAIKEAAFVLCLDKKPSVDEESDELTGVRQVLLGGTHGENEANRWFDKTVQLIVGENGHSGILFEPTPIDGVVRLALADHCCDYIEKNSTTEPSENVQDMPRKLEFDLSADDLNDIQAAKSSLSRIRDDAEVGILHFPSYGKDLIKCHHMSPDSFLQMAIQLAFHK